jgi:hypothetical protein
MKLSTKTKLRLRTVSLFGILLSFVLLYLGPVTLESDAVTIAGLVTAGLTAAVSWLSF